MPESPYLEYTITIDVPGMAAEVERKVTVVAEKVMNGLPSLLVLESSTTHEKSVVNLKFKAKTKEARPFYLSRRRLIVSRSCYHLKPAYNRYAGEAGQLP